MYNEHLMELGLSGSLGASRPTAQATTTTKATPPSVSAEYRYGESIQNAGLLSQQYELWKINPTAIAIMFAHASVWGYSPISQTSSGLKAPYFYLLLVKVGIMSPLPPPSANSGYLMICGQKVTVLELRTEFYQTNSEFNAIYNYIKGVLAKS